MNNSMPRALYIHIPFCTNKCFYCDFNSYVVEGQPVEAYLDALLQEMEWTAKKWPTDVVETVFIGGGTPTVLTPAQISRLMEGVRQYFPISEGAEVTTEANPGTTDEAKLAAMRDGGINRISFGAQSFDNALLKRIGRIHEAADVERSIALARQAGFKNLSIDLMFGLPDQTLNHMSDSLDRARELDLQHYSVYALKVEENTRFHVLYERGQLPLPDEEIELAMYQQVMSRLKADGYEQYEISNFAKPGKRSRHNTVYWRNQFYYGFGAGAHGYVDRQRHVNVRGVNPYIEACKNGLPRTEQFLVSKTESMEDYMIMGLRMLDGVSSQDFIKRYEISMLDVFAKPLQQLVKQNLLTLDQDRYKLTEKGLLFGNDVFATFLDCQELKTPV